jgi:hypothetical protein
LWSKALQASPRSSKLTCFAPQLQAQQTRTFHDGGRDQKAHAQATRSGACRHTRRSTELSNHNATRKHMPHVWRHLPVQTPSSHGGGAPAAAAPAAARVTNRPGWRSVNRGAQQLLHNQPAGTQPGTHRWAVVWCYCRQQQRFFLPGQQGDVCYFEEVPAGGGRVLPAVYRLLLYHSLLQSVQEWA